MKVCTCFLLFRIFAYANSSSLNTPQEDKRSTDLALKVVLESNVKENSKNVFLATNETVIDENKIPRLDFRAPRVETFTGFIQEVLNILNTYEDTAFADFFDILDEEIRKYHYRGCKFYELTENYEFRSLMVEKLDLIKRKPVPVLKADINEVMYHVHHMIRHGTYDKNVKEMLDYINSLYREDAREKFGKVLSDLKAYSNSTSERTKNDLVKIIRDGVRTIVFNHYTDLNINVRRELKSEIERFLKKIKEAPSSSSKTNPYKLTASESENTAKIETIVIEDKPEPSLKIDPTYISDNNNIRMLKTSDVKHQEEATKLETSKTENNSQQLNIKYLNTDESSDVTIEGNYIELSQDRQREFIAKPYATLYTEDISCNTTEKSEMFYKCDLKSKLVQRMLMEESTGLSIVQLTTAPKLRPKSTSNEDEAWPVDLRNAILSQVNARDVSDKRSIAPPLPEEDLSIDVFGREERKRQMSLAKSNEITTVQHGIKDYIKRMRNLQNKVNQFKKIDDYNKHNRMNVISNGYKVKNVVDEYEANKSNNKVREPKRGIKKTSSVSGDGPDIEINKEIVNNNDKHAYKLKNKKKAITIETTKATKSSKTVKSVKNPVQNNAGNTTVNDNYKKLTKTTLKVTKNVRNATLNVIEEVKQKIINKTATDDYVTKENPTRRYRRVLEFSSPPHYNQPFFDYHTFQEGLHPAHISN